MYVKKTCGWDVAQQVFELWLSGWVDVVYWVDDICVICGVVGDWDDVAQHVRFGQFGGWDANQCVDEMYRSQVSGQDVVKWVDEMYLSVSMELSQLGGCDITQ